MLDFPKIFGFFKTKISWTLGLYLLIFGFNFQVFKFERLASFRDFALYPEAFNINTQNNPFNIVVLCTFDWLRSLQLRAEVIATLYFSCLFTTGFILAHQVGRRSIGQLDPVSQATKSSLGIELGLLGLAMWYTYNPFTFERFLMGHERVLWGYFLLLPYWLVFFRYMYPSAENFAANSSTLATANSNAKTKLLPKILGIIYRRRNLIWLGLWTVIIALVHTHTAFYTLIISCIWILNQPLQYWKRSIPALFFPLSGLMASLLISYNILKSTTTDFYLSNIYANPDRLNLIVAAFSPQVSAGQDLVTRVLIGSASWNTPTLSEVTEIRAGLGDWANLSWYFNSNLSVLYLGLLGAAILGILLASFKRSNAKHRYLILGLIATGVISLILVFGYATEFGRHVNQFFYRIPGTYLLREPGKIMALTLSVTFLMISVGISRLRLRSNSLYLTLSSVILLLTAASGAIPFAGLSRSLNYFTYPALIADSVTICKQRTMAYLPNRLYIRPSYSKVFIANPFTLVDRSKCRIILPIKADLVPRDRTQPLLVIDNSLENNRLDEVLGVFENQQLAKVVDPNNITVDVAQDQQNAEQLYRNLRDLGIDLLLIDTREYQLGNVLIASLALKSKTIRADGDLVLLELNPVIFQST